MAWPSCAIVFTLIASFYSLPLLPIRTLLIQSHTHTHTHTHVTLLYALPHIVCGCTSVSIQSADPSSVSLPNCRSSSAFPFTHTLSLCPAAFPTQALVYAFAPVHEVSRPQKSSCPLAPFLARAPALPHTCARHKRAVPLQAKNGAGTPSSVSFWPQPAFLPSRLRIAGSVTPPEGSAVVVCRIQKATACIKWYIAQTRLRDASL